jgi:hypothetical protein
VHDEWGGNNRNLALKTQAYQQTRKLMMMMMMVKIRTGTGQDPLMQAQSCFDDGGGGKG